MFKLLFTALLYLVVLGLLALALSSDSKAQSYGYSHWDFRTGTITLGTITRYGNRIEIDQINRYGNRRDTITTGPGGIDHQTWGLQLSDENDPFWDPMLD